MSKFVSWYVVELDGLLRGRIPADRLHSLLSEVENHLNEAIEDRVARGMSREEAELATLEAMGSPEKMAEAELRLAGETPLRKWAFKATAGALIAMSVLWLFASLLPDTGFHPLIGIAWLLAAPVLIVGGFLARRLPWRLFVVAAVCGVISLANHQGTRHVYYGDAEFTLEAARTLLVANSPDPATQPGLKEVLTQELAKSSAQRTAQRLPGAIIALSLFMSLYGGFLWLFTRLPQGRQVHWLKKRLA